LAAEAECRRPVSRVRFLYLASGVEIRWSPEREDVDAVRQRMEELTTKLIASAGPQDFPASPGWQCRFCPVAAVCPDKDRVRPEDLEPHEVVPF
jgi:hypothetical protein